MKTNNSLGKRFMKAHNKFSAGGNNRLMDDPINITPFSQDMMAPEAMDGKAPYRTVIKRYWTEDEVMAGSLDYFRTRN